jgi:integrase
MSVLFNHACRYELFDRNPIYLVRQSAKRRRAPTVLMPAEIKAMVDNLGIRERTLVLLAVSTGLRQSELFGLKWSDIDFDQGTMNVTRSIVYGVVGPCKTESSQIPVPVHPLLAPPDSPSLEARLQGLAGFPGLAKSVQSRAATGRGGHPGDRPCALQCTSHRRLAEQEPGCGCCDAFLLCNGGKCDQEVQIRFPQFL